MISEERAILEEFKKGNHDAFAEIFEHYSKSLFQFSLGYLKSKEAAEDIVQEVFIKIWNSRRNIKTNTSFQSYLFKITLNSVRRYFNQLSRFNDLKHDILVESVDTKSDFYDRTDYQFMLDKLDEFIKRMPEKRREVFNLKKLEGKSLKEISEELNITTKTVEYHITEAMHFLKTEFEKLQIRGVIFFHLFIG